jgi:uncharacterized protein YecT (DUF1311 family)
MRIPLLVVLLLFANLAVGQSRKSDDDCPGPDTSTSFEACILSNQTAELDAKLNEKYRQLLQDAPAYSADAKQALIESQCAWLRYRDKTCAFQQAFLGGIVSINFVRCTHDLTAERLRYFESL